MTEKCNTCRLKNLAGKPIVTRSTGKKLGTVKDIVYDPSAGRLDAVTMETRGFFAPHRRFVLLDDIRSLGEDAIMVEDEGALKRVHDAKRENDIVNQDVPLMGKDVVTESGTLLGGVSDVIIDPGNGKAARYEVSGGAIRDIGAGRRSFPVPHAMVVGVDALVVPDSVEREMQEEAPGGIAGAYAESAEGAASLWDRFTDWWNRTMSRAQRATARKEAEFAEGKTAGTTVQDDAGNVIVYEGDEITRHTVEMARGKKKLRQLAMAAGWGATREEYESAKERMTTAAQDRGEEYVTGKQIDRPLKDEEGEVLIESGTMITPEIASRMRSEGRLSELAKLVAGSQMRSGSQTASQEARKWLRGAREQAGEAGEEISQRRLAAQQKSMASGKASATDIVDKEGNTVVKKGEIFTPMMLSHLDEQGLLDQIHLMPEEAQGSVSGAAGAPCVELIVRAEDVRRKQKE